MSTSPISFRLEELAKHLTTGASKELLVHVPLLMSKAIFDPFPKAQQDIVMAGGAELEAFGKAAAVVDDIKVADVYEKAGTKVYDLNLSTHSRLITP